MLTLLNSHYINIINMLLFEKFEPSLAFLWAKLQLITVFVLINQRLQLVHRNFESIK